MSIVSNPFTTVNIVNASAAVGNTPQKVIFVGQQTAAATAVSGALTQNILDDKSWDTLYGENSMLASMIRAARKVNKVSQFDAIGLDDASGTNASGQLAITGTATEAGTLIINIASETNHRFTVEVADTDTAAAVATAIKAAMDLDTQLPVTSIVTIGDVDVTAVHDGTFGNTLGLSIEGTVAGITTAVTGMASGATDPTLTGVFDVVGNRRYQGVAWPYAIVSELTGFLDPRFNVDNDVLDGAGFVSVTDTLANHLTRLGALNSENLVEVVDKLESETNFAGPAQLEIPAVKISQLAAIRALRLTEDASIGQFVLSANGPLDSFGGPALASKPYFNTPFPDLPLIGTNRGWTPTEIGQLEDAGGTIIGNNTSGTESVLGQVLTTFKTDTAGNPDLTFKFLNYRDTASGSREYFFNNLKSRFAQSRLTLGSVVRGRDQANDLTIAAFIERLYQDLAGPGFVLVQDGDDAIKFFKDNLVVTLDLALGKATVQMITPIVTQLRIILVTQKISFSAEA